MAVYRNRNIPKNELLNDIQTILDQGLMKDGEAEYMADKMADYRDYKERLKICKRLESKFTHKELMASGLYTKKGLIDYKPTIIIPYIRNKEIVYFSNRFIDSEKQRFM